MKAQTYMYGGKVWTHEEVMDLKDRRLRYNILHHDKVKQHNKIYDKLNREHRYSYHNNYMKFRRAFTELCMIDIF